VPSPRQGAAEEFLPDGFTVVSLTHRLKRPPKDVVTGTRVDGVRAVDLVRSRAAEWASVPTASG
jgi:hypothetical protein